MIFKIRSNVKIMGILNLSNDSFFVDKKKSIEENLNSVIDADIIDVGAQSSKPGSDEISVIEEKKRLDSALEMIKDKVTNQLLSIDTYRPEIALHALRNGFSIINDITGLSSDKMLKVISNYNAKVVIMHMKGYPKTMQDNPVYNDLIPELIDFFKKRINKALDFGINQKNIIIDPGIGFGKTFDDNYKILSNLQKFKQLGFPILIGLSRKAFLYNKLNDNPKSRLENTISANTIAILNGVDIIRVHDVESHIKVRNFLTRMSNYF